MSEDVKVLFVDDTQVRKYKITEQDLKGCDYDTLRLGYWIPKGSQQEVWLTLKGLTLRRLHYNPYNIPPKIPKNDIKQRTS
jgi:hypothetical protein